MNAMIHFNPETQTFNLILQRSYYAMQVDAAGRLVHLGWGARPRDATPDDRISGQTSHRHYETKASFETQRLPLEIVPFGDVATFQETLKVNFPSLPRDTAVDESLHLPIRDLRLRYARHDIADDAQPGLSPTHGLPVKNNSPRQTLRIHLQDPVQPFAVILCYRLTPEHDIIERWCELENNGLEPVQIEVCHFATLHLPAGTNELTAVTGSWAQEFMIQRQRLHQGSFILESRTLQTSHHANPIFMLNRPEQAGEESGGVYFGQLAYSGSWRLVFEQLPQGDVRVHGGYNPFDFELMLAPGERHITPALVQGFSDSGWGGASRRMHAFARERVLPHSPACPRFRPVLYNSWEATYFDLNYENQAALARRAAALGVELFCVDDGWFGGRRSDRAGLGDWVVSEALFPQGLEQLVQEVHRLGMRFGLWVEPEMVNPDSDLYRQHPDWVLHFPGRERTQARHQLILDYGRDEVVEHIFTVLDNLVERYAISFFKWDMNRNVTEPGSVAGKAIWYKHVAGVYSVMDRLRQKHPGLDIQSCSGGGGRVDLGMLGRADQVWVSDNTDAFDRLHIQEGFSLAYPARCMEAWVTHAHNHITRRAIPLSTRFAVAMRGALGIGSSLHELAEAELAEYATYIRFYKQIRPIIQAGDLYRLQRLEEFGSSAIEYVLPDGREAVYSLVVAKYQVDSFHPVIPLKGLIPAAMYTVSDHHGLELYRLSGYELMTLGIPKETQWYPGFCQTLHIKAAI